MAEVVVPQQPFPGMSVSSNCDASNGPSSGLKDTGPPLSTEPFVFPPPSGLPATPSSYHQRGSANTASSSHRRKPSNLSLHALPPFEFGLPGGELAAKPLPSPTRSPARPSPPGNHASGHRRGGSEFVGGDITSGGPVLVNSNLSQEEVISTPPSPSKGPPPGRPRHSHRRSGAVSQSDAKTIMQPPSEKEAESAPPTPFESHRQHRPLPPERSSSHPQPSKPTPARSEIPPQNLQPEVGRNRPRVGFSDNVDFAPRPLSTISSETSSSISTVRAQHSISESASSLVTGDILSPPHNQSGSSPAKCASREAHSATDAIATQGIHDDATQSEEQSSSRLLCTKQDSTFARHRQEPFSDGSKAKVSKAITRSIGKLESSPSPIETLKASVDRRDQQPGSTSDLPRPRTSPESKTLKKQQKVKSWAEMLLHRKDHISSESTRSPIQPSPSAIGQGNDSEFSLDDVNFDDDRTFIIEEPTERPQGPLTLTTDIANNGLEKFSMAPEHASASPMIDIDAALGSFRSPKNDPTFDDYFSKLSTGKRRLHSSGETGGFMGPGMHYHRRAESAPELEPFERSRFGFPRLGSNPAMAEAIEEEEEDVDPEGLREEQKALGLGVDVVDAEVGCDAPVRRPTSTILVGEQNGRGTAHAPDVLNSDNVIDIVAADEEPRCSVLTKSSDESSITPTISPNPMSNRPASAPLDSVLQTPSLTSGTTTETPSAVSSADYRKTIFDIHDPRIHTASSSITGVTLDSTKGGDQGTVSVDDVPSLTSSASTMLSGQPNRFSSSGNTFGSAERSASFSAPMPARVRPGSSSKRSSLASLSKLVVGPYNKSKLNIAETLPLDQPERTTRKRNRISRMVRFFKPKEKLSTG